MATDAMSVQVDLKWTGVMNRIVGEGIGYDEKDEVRSAVDAVAVQEVRLKIE